MDIPDRIVEMERLGRKAGAGYYRYDDGRTPVRDPLVEELIEQESSLKGIARIAFTHETIMDTLLDAMYEEGQAILAGRIADSVEAIDVVMVNGYGYPRWRGGPMYHNAVVRQRSHTRFASLSQTKTGYAAPKLLNCMALCTLLSPFLSKMTGFRKT